MIDLAHFENPSENICGLPGDIYRDLEVLLGRKISFVEREQFCLKFINSFISYLRADHLMIERQRSSL